MDSLDRLHLFFKVMAVIGFTILGVSLLGEYLGWWNAIGEFGALIGTVWGFASFFLAVLVGASKKQVRGVSRGVEQTNQTLNRMDTKLGKLDKLDSLESKLDAQTALLVQIRDRL